MDRITLPEGNIADIQYMYLGLLQENGNHEEATRKATYQIPAESKVSPEKSAQVSTQWENKIWEMNTSPSSYC